MKSDPRKFIFTEDLDYSKTPKQSIWGTGDTETLQFLNTLVHRKIFKGNWLNYAAGDGRYNNIILNEVESLVATDVDQEALNKLQKITPRELLEKLVLKTQDITKKFPFKDEAFDGVFNTGTLHLFPEHVLERIIEESIRVLKQNGIFIFDFATDIKRIREDGTFVESSDVSYELEGSKKLLSKVLSKRRCEADFIECVVPPEKVTSGEGTYTFSCNYWLVMAEKE